MNAIWRFIRFLWDWFAGLFYWPDEYQVWFSISGVKITGDLIEMELREGQKITVRAELKTAAGHDATYETSTAIWSSSNPTTASVEVNPDNELEAIVTGLDGSVNGSALITIDLDGDPDADEVRDIVGTIAVTVTQGEAVVVELSAGTPADA